MSSQLSCGARQRFSATTGKTDAARGVPQRQMVRRNAARYHRTHADHGEPTDLQVAADNRARSDGSPGADACRAGMLVGAGVPQRGQVRRCRPRKSIVGEDRSGRDHHPGLDRHRVADVDEGVDLDEIGDLHAIGDVGFSPMMQFRPIVAGARMCTVSHTDVPSPIATPSSIKAVGWMRTVIDLPRPIGPR